LFSVALFAVLLGVSYLAGWVLPHFKTQSQAPMLAAGLTVAAILLTLIPFLRWVDNQTAQQIGLQPKLNHLALGFALGALLQIGGFVTLYFSPILTVSGFQLQPKSLLQFLVQYFLVSIFEELLLRGYYQRNLALSTTPAKAILTASLLFAAMHFFNPNLTILALVNITAAGLVLGYAYHLTGNLSLPIGIHWSWNFFQGPVLGFAVSGTTGYHALTLQLNGPQWITGGDFGLEGSIICLLWAGILLALLHYFRYRLAPKQ
jgi:membrane protease YdiL (CAAX protease family)